jgi:DDE superfamily endonuclease
MKTIDRYSMKVEDIVFPHDNDPNYTAESTQQWVSAYQVNVLKWPAQSPDLNPMEHLWNEVERRLKKLPKKPKSSDDLWQKIQDVWNTIQADDCMKLIATIPQSVKDVKKASGEYARWYVTPIFYM